MTKAIRSYPKEERMMVIKRRIKNDVGGIGTWSAKDAMAKIGAPKKTKTEEEQQYWNSKSIGDENCLENRFPVKRIGGSTPSCSAKFRGVL